MALKEDHEEEKRRRKKRKEPARWKDANAAKESLAERNGSAGEKKMW